MKRVLQNDLIFLYTSIFCASVQNIITQMFFDRYYPDGKEYLVPLALFLGAAAMLAGIAVSGRAGRAGKPALYLRLGLVIAAFSLMFYTDKAVIYIVLFCVAGFYLNFLYNIFDKHIAATIDEKYRSTNVKVLLTYQMAGYIIAPVVFSSIIDNRPACILIAVAAGIVCYTGIISEYAGSGAVPGEPAGSGGAEEDTAGTTADRKIFFGFCFLVFTAIYILISSMAYLFKDVMHVSNYAVSSSIFLAAVIFICALMIVVLPEAGRTEQGYSLKRILLGPLLLAAAVAILPAVQVNTVAALGISAVVCGAGYGIFLRDSKSFVNFSADSGLMVSRYNKIISSATLSAYFISFAIGIISEFAGLNATLVKIGASLVLLMLSFGTLAVSLKKKRVR